MAYTLHHELSEGAVLAVLATVCGAVGFAWGVGAVGGRAFGMDARSRFMCAVGSDVFLALAFYVLSQWAAPLLRPVAAANT